MSSVASKLENLQYAALPWRRSENAELEILLVTTLHTHRWIVPKGWPLAGCTPGECAAREALEEAGVLGRLTEESVGSFQYDKHRKSGETVACTVHVFPLEVARQRRSWPEKAARQTRWCTIEEALARINEPGLRRLIANFARSRNVRPARHHRAAA
ncbi:MAG TPA: NUDIX hydrolase [Rhizomicrobium sp.]